MQPRPHPIPDWLPYLLPLALFLVGTAVEQHMAPSMYPFVYTAKILVVFVVLWVLRSHFPELKRNSSGVALSLLLGPLLTAAWILIDCFTPHLSIFGTRSAYDPFAAIANQNFAWLFIVIRLAGLSLIAPVIEELFYRSFTLRWIVNPDDFRKVPMGNYNTLAFVVVVLIMASGHPEYLAAAFFSAAMNFLLNRTKNLWATIAAHGSTNLCLGIYVLYAHAWKYW
jgi:CAAX prenyl protease-like protein